MYKTGQNKNSSGSIIQDGAVYILKIGFTKFLGCYFLLTF